MFQKRSIIEPGCSALRWSEMAIPTQPQEWSPLSDDSVENDEGRNPEGHTDYTWHLGAESVRDTRARLRLEKEKLL